MISSIFLGTPEAAVPALEAVARMSDLRVVVTMPDRARGRSAKLRPSPIKEAARGLGLPVAQPRSRRELLDAVAAIDAVDVGIVVAFGMLLRPEVLAVPRRGFVNVHFSLLPRWRGAAPVERAMLAGDEMTGATLMKMDAGLDTGPLIDSRSTRISPTETAGALTDRLSAVGAALLAGSLPAYVDGFLVPRPQDEEEVTYAPKIDTVEAQLDPLTGTDAVLRAIRAFNPRPGAFAYFDGRRIKVWEASGRIGADLEPGQVRTIGGEAVLGVAGGAVTLELVQPEGGRRMTGADWLRGVRGGEGRLG